MRWFVVSLAACGQPPAPAAPEAESPGMAEPARAPILTSPNNAGAKELVAELVAKGMTASPGEKPNETLVCNKDHSCVCMVDLDCSSGCITLAANLAQFDRALKSDTNPVSCEIADTGTLCDGAYFRFEGDIYRWETRYFDSSGAFIGQRNATDDPEYCGGNASVRFLGAQPRCAKATNVKTICTDHHHDHPLRNPRALLEDELFSR